MKYYAFKPYGRFVIAGPFRPRADAKPFGKPGHKCRVCGEYAGGNSICRTCICVAFNGGVPLAKPERKPVVTPITWLFCTA